MAVYGRVVWLELHTATLVSTAVADFLSSPRAVLPRAGWFIECSLCNGYTVEGPMAQITQGHYILKACLQQRNKKKKCDCAEWLYSFGIFLCTVLI